MNHRWALVLIALLCAADPARAESFTANAANLSDLAFWRRVNAALRLGPCEVVLTEKVYAAASSSPDHATFRIDRVGDAHNRLTIRPAAAGQATFSDDPADTARNVLLEFRDCQNLTLRDLTFTTPQSVASALSLQDVRHVVVEGCRFIDLPQAFYSAMSVTHEKTDDVVVRGCTFRRVGVGGTTHMIYGAYGVQRLSVVECDFTDCAGEFVRFRDESDYGVVFGCTFTSTGTYRNANPAMISVPLFNDDDPASRPAHPNYEYFGTHFLFANNQFKYGDAGARNNRFGVSFLHSGFDPPGRTHLLTKAQAATLASGSPDERRAVLKDHCGIELENVHIFGNRYEGVGKKLVYQAYPAFGAKSRGFAGIVDLSDLINETHVVQSVDEALSYYRK
jgi:hypothetical protein